MVVRDPQGAPSLERRALIVGLSGSTLISDEVHFLRDRRPCGIILFSRNFESNNQLQILIRSAVEAIGGGEILVLIDQEGGRVQRLRGAEWPDFPSAARFGALYDRDREAGIQAAAVASQGLGQMLRAVGINTNCIPCLDVPTEGADAIIGDRAYGRDPATVAAMGQAVAQGLLAAGVVPIMKHIPGHGRAGVDSHLALPFVDAAVATLRAQDFRPFRELADLPAAMTAHVTYAALDGTAPASISGRVTDLIIRKDIGFDGLLISDDISMAALDGSIKTRAAAVVSAGSDVILHCNGRIDEMTAAASVAPILAGAALRRYQRCLDVVAEEVGTFDVAAFEEAIEKVAAI